MLRILLGLASLLVIAACAADDQDPTPDVVSAVRDAVRESMPTPAPQHDIAATARAIVQESVPTPVVVPDSEATARAVVRAALPEPVSLPDIEATAKAVVIDAAQQVPDGEATARAVVQVVLSSLPEPPPVPDIEATARFVAAEESSNLPRYVPPSATAEATLRATMQSMVPVRRYEDDGLPISINEVMVHAVKFLDPSYVPDEFRLRYEDFIGFWLDHQALESWMESNANPAEVRGICCYYLNQREPALYRAAILDLPLLTKLINDAEELGIDSKQMARALDRVQDGYVIVYESFTW